MKRDLISFSLWEASQLLAILDLAGAIKSGRQGDKPFSGKTAALIFEKESLRTRVSFEVGIAQLGGNAIFLQQETIGIATRESVLSRYNDLLIARTSRHLTCVQLAESAAIPVINAMTDLVHPCQVLADLFTMRETGKTAPNTKIVFVGAGNNIVNSWLELAEKLKLHFVFSCPPGYEPHPQILEQAMAGGTVESIQDPMEAVQGADVIYTDLWSVNRGSPGEGGQLASFKPYQVNETLLRAAKADCVVMHRLPANRGEEITREVLDGKQSIVLRQAENRLHVQKGIMTFLLGK
jgi:ornithine carbamoyltransferase